MPALKTTYDPKNWYWIVADSITQVYSSAVAGYVPLANPTYVAWLAAGNKPTRISTEQELFDVLAAQYPAGLPAANTAALDLEWTSLPVAARKLLFWHENRIRVIEGKAALSLAQFIVIYRLLGSPS